MRIVFKSIDPKLENPFRSHPELKSVWQPDLAALAEEAIDDAAHHPEYFPNGNIGEIFLAYVDENLVGITGYMPSSEDDSEFFLRWHGLLAPYRGHGHSMDMVKYVTDRICSLYPRAQKLIEIMPVIESYSSVKAYFEKNGFVAQGQAHQFDWSPYLWQAYHLDIRSPSIGFEAGF